MTLTAGLAEQIAAVVETVDFGRPSARKEGRDNRWPYVPVIITDDHGIERQRQTRARAFATRGDAIVCAADTIERQRIWLAAQLADPRKRALREHYGLPREATP